MRSYPSWIAGIQYPSPDGTDRATYCAGLAIGSALRLKPEPDNAYDESAVALHHENRHVGYVPRRHSWVGDAINEGKVLECCVVDIEIAGGFLRRRRAEHVETRITIVAEVDPRILADREALRRARRERKELEDRARLCCHDGLRVLAYLTTIDGLRSPDEHNLEISVIESRLIAGGFERDAELLAMLSEQAAALSVGKAAMTRSVNALAKDESYFRLVYDAAGQIAGLDGQLDAKESEVFDRLLKAGRQNGWL